MSSVSSVSTPAAYVPPQAPSAPPPSTNKVDRDGDHDGDKGGKSDRLLEVKA